MAAPSMMMFAPRGFFSSWESSVAGTSITRMSLRNPRPEIMLELAMSTPPSTMEDSYLSTESSFMAMSASIFA